MIKEVRNKGKRIYKSNFWKVVAVCFITAIMTGGSTIYLIRNEYNSNNSNLIHQSGIKVLLLLLLIIFIVLTRLYLEFLMLLMNWFLKIR